MLTFTRKDEPMAEHTLNNHEAVAPQVYSFLRRDIVAAKLMPGRRLSEKEVSERLGVSRQPVREAFIKLVEDGLVEIRPQRGTFVRKISVKAVKDSRFVREAIELAIIDEIKDRFPEGFRGRQRAIIGRQREAATRNDLEAFFIEDEGFHRSFAEAADRDHAWTVIENEKAQWDRVRFLTMPKVSPMPHLARQHECIVEALEQGLWEEAKSALRLHLREALATLPMVASEWPNLFEE